MPYKTLQARKEYLKEWHRKHPNWKLEYSRKYRERNRDKINKKNRKSYWKDVEKSRQHTKNWRNKIKIEIITHYGGKCACCGEARIEFLSIDHIDGGGMKHLRSLGFKQGGTQFYCWLRRENYPKGFRVLCFNCNRSYGMYGYCPHQKD